MLLPFIVLVCNTVLLWMLVTLLHWYKNKITIIPFYCLIAVLTLLTHIISSFGLNLTYLSSYFFISSTAYFTPLLLAIIILYLAEGVHATRKALEMILLTSVLLVSVVAFSSVEDPTHPFILSNFETYKNYAWSIFAMFVDVVIISVGWELINKIKKVPTLISLILLIFVVYLADTLIYVNGVFYDSPIYWNIIKGDLIVRGALSLLMGTFLSIYLFTTKFSEEKRPKPKNLFEILNFKSEDEKLVNLLSTQIQEKETAEKELIRMKDLYQNVLEGSEVGIWEWNMVTNEFIWSDKLYSILGYEKEDLSNLNYEKFRSLIHPDDNPMIDNTLENHLQKGLPFHVEHRIRTKDGYRWIAGNGIVHYDSKNKPIRMVGSIMDINGKKMIEEELKQKVEALSKLNKFFVDRELKLKELKDKLKEK